MAKAKEIVVKDAKGKKIMGRYTIVGKVGEKIVAQYKWTPPPSDNEPKPTPKDMIFFGFESMIVKGFVDGKKPRGYQWGKAGLTSLIGIFTDPAVIKVLKASIK